MRRKKKKETMSEFTIYDEEKDIYLTLVLKHF